VCGGERKLPIGAINAENKKVNNVKIHLRENMNPLLRLLAMTRHAVYLAILLQVSLWDIILWTLPGSLSTKKSMMKVAFENTLPSKITKKVVCIYGAIE
jgi:uncharacterized membrane protein YqjE